MQGLQFHQHIFDVQWTTCLSELTRFYERNETTTARSLNMASKELMLMSKNCLCSDQRYGPDKIMTLYKANQMAAVGHL